jgi:hypothetical protein
MLRKGLFYENKEEVGKIPGMYHMFKTKNSEGLFSCCFKSKKYE